jgi:outer membrane protein
MESDSALYLQKQREAKLYPQIQLSLNGGLHDYTQNYDLQTDVSEIYKSYTLSLSQPIYHPEIFTSIDQGKLRTEGAKTQTYKSSQDLGADVAKAYFEYIVAYKSLESAQANHNFYALKYSRINEMLLDGLSNKMDLLETQIYRDRAMMEINVAQKKVRLSQRKLEDLMLTPFKEVPTFAPNFLQNLEALKIQNTSGEQNNPDIRISNLSRRIAEQEINLRKFEHYPKADLSLSRSENETNDNAMYKVDNRAYVQISIPLYQGGYTNARIDEAKLLYTAAIEKELQARQEFHYQVEELTEQFDLTLQNLYLLDTARKSAQLNLSAVEIAQKSGLKSQIELLEAQAKLYQIEQESLLQFRDLAINHIALLQLNGILDTETLHMFEKQIFALPMSQQTIQ